MSENRPTCWQCLRPVSHCHCQLIAPFLAHCNTVILQHPREKKRFYSTAKLLTQWIQNCTLVRGIAFDKPAILDLFPNTTLAVLFPRGPAVPANPIRLSEATTVIVLDGTWSEAKKIYRENTWLAALPHVSLSPFLRSRYRIRKQPRPECLSTIEALAYMFLENSASPHQKTGGYLNLLEGFDRMVDTHLQSIPADKRSYYDARSE
jgi:DTW domain-containing protein YfiP